MWTMKILSQTISTKYIKRYFLYLVYINIHNKFCEKKRLSLVENFFIWIEYFFIFINIFINILIYKIKFSLFYNNFAYC